VKAGDTADPAGVSAPIKLLIDRNTAVSRLQKAAGGLTEALDNDTDEAAVRAALAKVFWKYVDEPNSQLASVVAAMQERKPVTTAALGLAGPSVAVAPARAYGSGRR
jgi:hypothetical protein